MHVCMYGGSGGGGRGLVLSLFPVGDPDTSREIIIFLKAHVCDAFVKPTDQKA